MRDQRQDARGAAQLQDDQVRRLARPRRLGVGVGLGAVALLVASQAAADTLVALAPADDARKAIAIGPGGEVYEPRGGEWVRTMRFATATTLVTAGRAGGDVVASGGGVVYRLAPNGWSALRLAQAGAATMSPGPRAVGAIGRQVYALDRLKGGEPEKLALLPAPVIAIGSGAAIVVATAAGVHRVERGKVTRIPGVPAVRRFVDDRWALLATGAYDLKARKTIAWPAGAQASAAVAVGDTLLAGAVVGGKLELLTVAAGKVERTAIAATGAACVAGRACPDLAATGTPVGIAADRAGRVVIALADGTLVVRAGATWTATKVRDEPPAPRPGPAPALQQ